jgi:cytidine deaminase
MAKVTPELILKSISVQQRFLSVFESKLLTSLQEDLKCTLHELLLGLAELAQYRSITVISHFNVGAVAYCSSGNAYLGHNIEIEKITLAQTIHAEQCAIVNAWYHGEKHIDMIITNVVPCGYCRQFMTELPDSKNLKILTSGYELKSLIDLLPSPFGPDSLGLDSEKENLLMVNNSGLLVIRYVIKC